MIKICTTNIDLHYIDTDLSGIAKYWNVHEKDIQEQHCLGLCFLCQHQPLVWKNNAICTKD